MDLRIKHSYEEQARAQEKKEEIWLSPMTKASTPTENSKKQRDNTKTANKIDYTTIADRLTSVTYSYPNLDPHHPACQNYMIAMKTKVQMVWSVLNGMVCFIPNNWSHISFCLRLWMNEWKSVFYHYKRVGSSILNCHSANISHFVLTAVAVAFFFVTKHVMWGIAIVAWTIRVQVAMWIRQDKPWNINFPFHRLASWKSNDDFVVVVYKYINKFGNRRLKTKVELHYLSQISIHPE